MRKYRIPQDVQWNDIEYLNDRRDFWVDTDWQGLGDFVNKLHNDYYQYYIPIVVSTVILFVSTLFSNNFEFGYGIEINFN